jgi:acyl-coenzyme A thioesterase PaaI-like protein
MHMSDQDREPFGHRELMEATNGSESTAVSLEQRAEWRRLVDELRRALSAAVELDAPLEELVELADQVRELAARMEPHAVGKGIPLFGPGPDAELGDVSAALPFSPVAGIYNPIAAPLRLAVEGERVVGRVRFGSLYQGAPNLVHGAVVSGAYDEVLAAANMIRGVPGPTARLTIDYREPTPLHTDLRFEAWVESSEGRKVFTRGRCLVGQRVASEASGIFVRIQRPRS